MLPRLFGIALAGALLVGGFGTQLAAAQVAPPPRIDIAVVDVQKILRESAASRTIRPQLEKLKKEYQAEFKQKEDALRAANQDLNRQRAILSPEAYEVQRKAFRERATAAQREVQTARRRFDGALAAAMRKVHGSLLTITKKYAEERGIKMILPKSSVLMMVPNFDITGEILARLNKKLPSLKIELPPVPNPAPRGTGNKK